MLQSYRITIQTAIRLISKELDAIESVRWFFFLDQDHHHASVQDQQDQD